MLRKTSTRKSSRSTSSNKKNGKNLPQTQQDLLNTLNQKFREGCLEKAVQKEKTADEYFDETQLDKTVDVSKKTANFNSAFVAYTEAITLIETAKAIPPLRLYFSALFMLNKIAKVDREQTQKHCEYMLRFIRVRGLESRINALTDPAEKAEATSKLEGFKQFCERHNHFPTDKKRKKASKPEKKDTQPVVKKIKQQSAPTTEHSITLPSGSSEFAGIKFFHSCHEDFITKPSVPDESQTQRTFYKPASNING